MRSASTVRTSAVASLGSRYVTIGHPVGDGVVDQSDKSTTTASGRAIAPDGVIVCELFEGKVHAEFGLLHTGDQHLVTVKEVLQFCNGSVGYHYN